MRQPPNLLARLQLALLLAWKDCVIRFQSGVTLVFVVVLPLAMVLLTGLAFQGFEPRNLVVTLALEDNDKGGELGRRVRAELERPTAPPGATAAQVRLLPENLDPAEARRRIREGELDGLLVVPAGLSQRLASKEEARLDLLVGPRETVARSVLESAVDRLVCRLRERDPRPLTWLPVPEGADTRLVEGFNSFSQAVAGNGVMFILLNCILIGAMSIVRERQYHTLDRLLISPMTRGTIFLGKVLGVYALGLVQALVIFGFGAAVGVALGSILGVALVTLLFILVGSALALMISALGQREQTVQDVGAAVSLLLAALGGGMFPLQLAPPWMRQAALLFPTGWAMQAYEKLMWEGKPWTAVLPHLLVLAAFAAVFFFIGTRALRRQAG